MAHIKMTANMFINARTHTNASATDCLDDCNGHSAGDTGGFNYHWLEKI